MVGEWMRITIGIMFDVYQLLTRAIRACGSIKAVFFAGIEGEGVVARGVWLKTGRQDRGQPDAGFHRWRGRKPLAY
jgi:hypothetical protein